METTRVTVEQVKSGQDRPYGPNVSTYIVTFERFGPVGCFGADLLNAERQPHVALAVLGYDDLYKNCRDEMDRHFTGTVKARHLGPGSVEVVRSVPFND